MSPDDSSASTWTATAADRALIRLAAHVARGSAGVVRLQPARAARWVAAARRDAAEQAQLSAVLLTRVPDGAVDVEVRVAVALDAGPAAVARSLAAALSVELGRASDCAVRPTVVIADIVA